ncbi:hypothetical protein PGT21_019039 [Puccinia graminis f. sp. tritici]|uniref:Uncharacterized protein n=1 Tax=Puccinia graminis f. sp. tritici TaxID=56615 RepID=A0A5B0P1R1_PUCGR|nr:hypothetical protein PGT21_019039 [Puccinia graminis f. sp. tritici]
MKETEAEKSLPDSEDLSDDPVSNRYSELKEGSNLQEDLDAPQTQNDPLPTLLTDQSIFLDAIATIDEQRDVSGSDTSRTKQRKTQIIGTASARKGSASRREGRSGDSNSGSETSAALQNALTSSREHFAPGGAERLNVIHRPILLNISEDGSPVPDESVSTGTSVLVAKNLVPQIPTVTISNMGENYSNNDKRSQTENTRTKQAQPVVEGKEQNENSSDEDRSAWEKRQQRELYESDESDDFHPLGVSLLQVNPALPGPSAAVNWDSNHGVEKTGWESWPGKTAQESQKIGLNMEMDWRSNPHEDPGNVWRDDSTEEMDKKTDEEKEPQISGGFIIDVDIGGNEKETPVDSVSSTENQSRLIFERAKKDLEDEFWQPFPIPPGKDKNDRDRVTALSEEFGRRSQTLKNNTILSRHEKERNEHIERWREGPQKTPGNQPSGNNRESYLSSLNPPNMEPRKRMQSLPLQGKFNKKEFGSLMKGSKRMNEELIPSRQRLIDRAVREGGVFNSRKFGEPLKLIPKNAIGTSKRARLNEESADQGWGWNASASTFGFGEPSSPVERLEKGKGRAIERDQLDETMDFEDETNPREQKTVHSTVENQFNIGPSSTPISSRKLHRIPSVPHPLSKEISNPIQIPTSDSPIPKHHAAKNTNSSSDLLRKQTTLNSQHIHKPPHWRTASLPTASSQAAASHQPQPSQAASTLQQKM